MARRLSHQALWILRQVAAVVLAIFVYFRVRGLTVGREETALDHANDVLALEKRLNLDHEHRLQVIATSHDWITNAANWVYIWGHWPVIVVVMVWLAVRHREHFLRLRNAMFISGGIGLVIFATYPVAPPRLTSLGYIDTVLMRSEAYRVLQPPAFVNPYAAMPSLHVGWDLLVGIAVASAASTAVLRWIGYAMPVLMSAAVVLTANHYLVDGMAGAALALVGLGLAVLFERLVARRAPHVARDVPEPRAADHDNEQLHDALASDALASDALAS